MTKPMSNLQLKAFLFVFLVLIDPVKMQERVLAANLLSSARTLQDDTSGTAGENSGGQGSGTGSPTGDSSGHEDSSKWAVLNIFERALAILFSIGALINFCVCKNQLRQPESEVQMRREDFEEARNGWREAVTQSAAGNPQLLVQTWDEVSSALSELNLAEKALKDVKEKCEKRSRRRVGPETALYGISIATRVFLFPDADKGDFYTINLVIDGTITVVNILEMFNLLEKLDERFGENCRFFRRFLQGVSITFRVANIAHLIYDIYDTTAEIIKENESHNSEGSPTSNLPQARNLAAVISNMTLTTMNITATSDSSSSDYQIISQVLESLLVPQFLDQPLNLTQNTSLTEFLVADSNFDWSFETVTDLLRSNLQEAGGTTLYNDEMGIMTLAYQIDIVISMPVRTAIATNQTVQMFLADLLASNHYLYLVQVVQSNITERIYQELSLRQIYEARLLELAPERESEPLWEAAYKTAQEVIQKQARAAALAYQDLIYKVNSNMTSQEVIELEKNIYMKYMNASDNTTKVSDPFEGLRASLDNPDFVDSLYPIYKDMQTNESFWDRGIFQAIDKLPPTFPGIPPEQQCCLRTNTFNFWDPYDPGSYGEYMAKIEKLKSILNDPAIKSPPEGNRDWSCCRNPQFPTFPFSPPPPPPNGIGIPIKSPVPPPEETPLPYVFPTDFFYPDKPDQGTKVKIDPVFKYFPPVPFDYTLPSFGSGEILTMLCGVLLTAAVAIPLAGAAAGLSSALAAAVAAKGASITLGAILGPALVAAGIAFIGDVAVVSEYTINHPDPQPGYADSLPLSNKSDPWSSISLTNNLNYALQEPIAEVLENNLTLEDFNAKVGARIATQYHAALYQDILMSQYAQISPDYVSLASQTFDLVTEAQQPVTERMLANFHSSLWNQSFYILDYDDTYPIIHVTLHNYTDRQIDDLEGQLDLTISNYFRNNLTLQAPSKSLQIYNESKEYSFSSLEYTILFGSYIFETDEPFFYGSEELPAPSRLFDFELYNLTSSQFNEIAVRINQTLYQTFYLAADFDEPTKARLVSSIKNLTGDPTMGEEPVVAAFTATQTDLNYYHLALDGGYSYSQFSGPLLYSWDFGDGKLRFDINVSAVNYTYSQAGNYTVLLNVTDLYMNSATASTQIQILYTLVNVSNGKTAYVSSRSQDFMWLSGNVYTPIHPIVQGSNLATLFELDNLGGSIYRLKIITEIPALIDTYLGFWGYESLKSWIQLQASSLPDRDVTVVTPPRFNITPLTGYYNEGYYSIQYDRQYLNVYGGLNDTFDDRICAFTFLTQPLAPTATLESMIASSGTQNLSEVQILSYFDPRNGLLAPSGSALFDFNAKGNGYYTISDILNPNSLLTSMGMGQDTQMLTPYGSENQLWTIGRARDKTYNLISKANNLCLKLDVVTSTLTQGDCNAVNKDFCYDKKGNYVYNTAKTCTQQYDMMCADNSLLLIPIVGYILWLESFKPCKSGKYYCQKADDQKIAINEGYSWPFQTCTFKTGESTPENLWNLNHTNAINIQKLWMDEWVNMADIGRYTKTIKNAGNNLFIQMNRNARPYLANQQDGGWDMVTYGSNNRQLDPDQTRWGYLIAGAIVDPNWKDWYLCGDINPANDKEVWTQRLKYGVLGHYWILEQAGYNVFRIIYKHDYFDYRRLCLTPEGNNIGSLLYLSYCEPYNKYQYWSIGDYIYPN